MSRFKTCIPVNVGAVLKLLPPHSFVHGHKFNPETNQVEIEWEHDQLKTPYTFAMEFPVASLETKQIPRGVQVLNGGTTPQKAVEVSREKPEVVSQDETAPGEIASDSGGAPEPAAKGKRTKRAAVAGGDGA
jgi:hypothetical protein